MSFANPSIDLVRSMGLRDLALTCPECGERFTVPFSAIDLPGDTSLLEVGEARQFPCAKCSAPGCVDLEAMGFGNETAASDGSQAAG